MRPRNAILGSRKSVSIGTLSTSDIVHRITDLYLVPSDEHQIKKEVVQTKSAVLINGVGIYAGCCALEIFVAENRLGIRDMPASWEASDCLGVKKKRFMT